MKSNVKILGFVKKEEKDLVPFISSKIHAGNPNKNFWEENIEMRSFSGFFVDEDNSFLLMVVTGESMIEMHITPGDYLLVDVRKEPQNGDIVAVELNGENAVKLYDEEDGVVTLYPANKHFKPIVVTNQDQFRVLGVVKSKHTPLMKDGCHIIGRVKREYNDKLRLEVESCKARDKYNFRNYILDQEKIPTLLEKLHKLIDGKKGKDVAVVLQCAIELRLIDKPSYLDVLQEFPKIGAKSGYYTYIDYEYFAEKTKESIKDELREV